MTDNARIVREALESAALCPFCGSGDFHVEAANSLDCDGNALDRVVCYDCGSLGPCAYTKDGAIDRWNRRSGFNVTALETELATLKADLARAREALEQIGDEARDALIETPKGMAPMMMAPWVAGTAYAALAPEQKGE